MRSVKEEHKKLIIFHFVTEYALILAQQFAKSNRASGEMANKGAFASQPPKPKKSARPPELQASWPLALSVLILSFLFCFKN